MNVQVDVEWRKGKGKEEEMDEMYRQMLSGGREKEKEEEMDEMYRQMLSGGREKEKEEEMDECTGRC